MHIFNHGLIAHLKSGCSAAALCAIATVSLVGNARAQDSSGLETVVVTGFKASLERALDSKRNATGSEDQILAEDISKFPDINLSESIQRIPGIALNRTSGEGKQITVRGLSPLFTTTHIDGMETITNSGNNVGRSFDFNVFSSDLFSGITVHKTASASVQEGALGATVDLTTAHPFDHQGFTLVGSGEGSYNDLNGGVNSRFGGLASDTLLNGTLGLLFSGGYQSRNIMTWDTDSVGWQNDNTPRP
jgi:iron complex outermembrane receptor protein